MTVVLLVALAFAGCGGTSKKAKTKAVVARKPPAPAVAPLTGLADPGGVARGRCAITVKVDNTRFGRPKYGVEQADVVYEEVVEGFYTRLAAVFNSHAPDRVGPVRSVRKTDHSLVTPLRGIFAYSGGAAYAMASIDTAPVVQLDETRAGATMFRDHSRNPPWNLYAHVDQMYSRCKDPAPAPLFTYGASSAGGAPASSVLVGFVGEGGDFAVRWTWDAVTGTWKRRMFGGPDVSAAGVQYAPKNVVVMFVQYVGGDATNEGAEAVLTGTGKLEVFTGGKMIAGTWSRPNLAHGAQLLDATGVPIRLAPGQTWVELPFPNYSVTVTP
jgi:hypothetical protein